MSAGFTAFSHEFARAFLAALAEMVPGGRIVLERSGFLGSAQSSVDERLKKIEAARSNLAEALEAIDELKDEAERNRGALVALTAKLEEREREKGELDAKVSELRTLAEVSASTVQQVFRVPTPAQIWAERAIGFMIGVAASVAASFIYAAVV